jgi:DNA-binding YbaB/EbfC family protein
VYVPKDEKWRPACGALPPSPVDGDDMKDLMKMMQQAQEIQGRMQQLQDDLANLEVEGQSGAGLVKVKLNGKGDVRAIKIDQSLIKPEETEILEDLIVAALQDAKSKVEAAVQAKMQEITGGLALPPGLKLF